MHANRRAEVPGNVIAEIIDDEMSRWIRTVDIKLTEDDQEAESKKGRRPFALHKSAYLMTFTKGR